MVTERPHVSISAVHKQWVKLEDEHHQLAKAIHEDRAAGTDLAPMRQRQIKLLLEITSIVAEFAMRQRRLQKTSSRYLTSRFGAQRGNSPAAGYLVSVIFDCYGSPNPICSIKLVSSRVDAMVVAMPTSLIMDQAMRNSADDQGPAMRGGDAEQGFGLRRAEHADG